MRIYCKYNLFWIKWAKVEVLKLILSSDIAFSRKKGCYNFSLRPHDGFSWTKVKIVSNLCSYGSKCCNFKVSMYKYFSMLEFLHLHQTDVLNTSYSILSNQAALNVHSSLDPYYQKHPHQWIVVQYSTLHSSLLLWASNQKLYSGCHW